jgi:hypothetical protein
MKHAVKHIHFVGIGGHVGGGAPTSFSAAMPLPPDVVEIRR